MKGLLLSFLISLFLISPAMAADQWCKTDKLLFTSFTILEIIDYGQTKYILKHPDQYRERNPVIRKFGKKGLPFYFAGCVLGTYLIADNLKPGHRRDFLAIMNFIQIGFVANNLSIGIKISF